ncbi:hypothetical protein EL06_20890 [Salmonella enterica subsp. diarizonae]|uniref:ImpA C-terminal domain-containing protein n=1 Tax=Salmonella diarizonae TaxID=59204 RepID=A0A6C8Y1I1_SALDZ|nr:hypothetical protein [Salmonella enterica subsp. diarizonae]
MAGRLLFTAINVHAAVRLSPPSATVSELKSQVFHMLTSFRQTVPVEEQLRRLKLFPECSPLRQQQIQQAEQHVRAQTCRLAQGKNNVTDNWEV